MSPWRRRLLRALSALVLLATGLFVTGYFLFNSQWLREQIRLRALREITTATGGRPEIGRFDFDPRTWQVTLDNLVLHGTEPPPAPPLYRSTLPPSPVHASTQPPASNRSSIAIVSRSTSFLPMPSS